MARPQDFLALQDRAAEAGSLLGHKIFQEAVAGLKETYTRRLWALPVGDPKILELHAKTKMIDELVGELKAMVSDLRFAKKPED